MRPTAPRRNSPLRSRAASQNVFHGRDQFSWFSSFGGGTKLDALRQGQIRRIVDGVCLAAHVIFPGIAAALASAPGFLFPTERAANFRAARAGVDVGNPAIAAARAQEFLRLAEIVGEDAGAESLGHGVV